MNREWLLLITLSHWLWVTSYFPSQKPLVSVTECSGSLERRPDSPDGLPIWNFPGPHQIISIFAPPGSVTVRVSPIL